jgi:DNA-binding phage protein
MARRRTAYDRYRDEQMKSRTFDAAYRAARREIDAIDSIIRMLDRARIDVGMTKAALARQISAQPEIVRRLFTTEHPNPTLSTVVKLATAVGCRLALLPASRQPRQSSESSEPRRRRAASSRD